MARCSSSRSRIAIAPPCRGTRNRYSTRSSDGTSSGWQWASAWLSRSRQSTRQAAPASSSRLWNCTAHWTATSWESDPRFRNILIHQYLYIPHTYQGFSILLAHLVDQNVHCSQLLLRPQVVQGLPAPETVKNQRKHVGDVQNQQHQPPLVAYKDEVFPAGNSRNSHTPRLSTIWPGRSLYIGPVIFMMSLRSSEASRILSPIS